MGSEHKQVWQSVLELYRAASELPREQARAFVESASCTPEIRREVLALLEELDSRPEAIAGVEPPRTGDRIGRYVVEGEIGRGGMGRIYSAYDTELERRVALKVVAAEGISGRTVDSLKREALAASALNHPNAVTVHEVIRVRGSLAIVMELVEGEALRTLTGQPLALERLLPLMRQAASAVAAAHARGIVHRDLKPENIMVREDGYVKVLDFGLARHTDGTGALTGYSSYAGLPAGTLRYMSPEQIRGDKLTAATDVYSLGLILYEVAAGAHPFAADSALATAHAISTQTASPPSARNPAIPPRLEALILSMLRRDPAERPAAAEAAAELASMEASPAPRAAPPAGRVQRIALPVLAGVLGAAFVVALLWPRGEHERPLLVPVPFTSEAGWEWGPQFSPDGRSIAYARGAQDEGPQVVVQLTAGGRPVEIAGPERNSFSPVWSSDGNRIALLRKPPGQPDALSDLVVLPALGGSERTIARLYTPSPFQNFAPGPYLDWSPDDRYVVACDRQEGQTQHHLTLVSVGSGEKRALTDSPPTIFGDFSPRFSPDGRRIAFSRVLAYGISDLWVLDLSPDYLPEGPPRQIATGALWNASPAWTPDGRALIYISDNFRNPRLYIVEAEGNSGPAILPVPDSGVVAFDAIGTGRDQIRLAYTRFRQDEDIWKVRLPKDGPSDPARTPEAVRVVDSSYYDITPRVSPDGTRFVFVSNRTGSDQLWLAKADGTDPMALTDLKAASIGRPAWSPDGSQIAFGVLSPDAAGIHVIDAGGGPPRQLVESEAGEAHPAWSTDGLWLYFSSRKSGDVRIWKVPAQGGEPVMAADFRAEAPQFTPDGSSLIYLDRGVYLRPVSGAGPVRLFESLYGADHLDVAADGVYVTPVTPGGERQALFFYPFAGPRARTAYVYPRGAHGGLSVFPDGTSALVSMRDHIAIDILLVDGVTARQR